MGRLSKHSKNVNVSLTLNLAVDRLLSSQLGCPVHLQLPKHAVVVGLSDMADAANSSPLVSALV